MQLSVSWGLTAGVLVCEEEAANGTDKGGETEGAAEVATNRVGSFCGNEAKMKKKKEQNDGQWYWYRVDCVAFGQMHCYALIYGEFFVGNLPMASNKAGAAAVPAATVA